jgi:hypothetical protein
VSHLLLLLSLRAFSARRFEVRVMLAEPLPGANTPASVDGGKTWEGVRQVSRIVSCPADMELSSAKGRRIWHSNARV